MTILITTAPHGKRFIARATTTAGRLVGQAIDGDPKSAEKRAARQARKWALDYGFPSLTIKYAPPSYRKPTRVVT